MIDTKPSQNTQQLASSFVKWWQDAGVDYLVQGETESWLEPQAEEAPQPFADHAVAEKAAKAASAAPLDIAYPETLPQTEWPDSIEKLQAMLSAGATFPGSQYSRQKAVPRGSSNAKCVAILDLPSQKDLDSGQLGSGSEGQLLTNMLAAIGIARDDSWITALATSRPATGSLPENDYPAMAEFIHHQLNLIKPEKIIIFGSPATQALLGAEMMQSRGNLHNFNHKVQKVAALTTFHPRSLLARPQLKAQAWKDLQILLK